MDQLVRNFLLNLSPPFYTVVDSGSLALEGRLCECVSVCVGNHFLISLMYRHAHT